MARDFAISASSPEGNESDMAAEPPRNIPVGLGYALSIALVAAATLVAFVVDHIPFAANLSLIYVVPVVVASLSFGWGPALMAALLSVAVLDFLFIAPRMSFRVASPADLWALGLLLVVAAITSTAGARSRGRALAARRGAEQAEALHALAHGVIESAPRDVLIQMAAEALGRIFDAPAVILAEKAGKLAPAASCGGAALSADDQEAAQWTLANDQRTHAETYPFDQAVFDFWPVQTPADRRLVLGVKLIGSAESRPAAPDHLVEMVAAYLANTDGGAVAGRPAGASRPKLS
jgi:K+-sensing histidine kinase KdpD